VAGRRNHRKGNLVLFFFLFFFFLKWGMYSGLNEGSMRRAQAASHVQQGIKGPAMAGRLQPYLNAFIWRRYCDVNESAMRRAQAIIGRLRRRDLYRYVQEVTIPPLQLEADQWKVPKKQGACHSETMCILPPSGDHEMCNPLTRPLQCALGGLAESAAAGAAGHSAFGHAAICQHATACALPELV